MNELYEYAEEIQDLIVCSDDYDDLEIYVTIKASGVFAWNLSGKNAVAIVTHDSIELM